MKQKNSNFDEIVHEVNQKYELILQANNEGIWDWNITNNDVTYSTRFAEQLGYQKGELVNRFETFVSLLNPEDQQKTQIAIDNHLSRKKTYEIEFRLKHKLGHWVPILSRGQAVWDDNDKPVRMVGSHLDLTELKYAENKLRQVSNELEGYLGLTDDIVLIINESQKVISSNRTANNLLFNNTFFSNSVFIDELFESSSSQSLKSLIEEISNGNQVSKATINTKLKKSDKILIIDWKVTRYSSQDNFVAVGRDITSLMLLQEQLKSREALLNYTAEISKVGGWEIDLKTGNPRWSDQVYKIHEVPIGEQAVMEKAIEFYAPEARPIIKEAVENGMKHGIPWDLELPFITAKGRNLWVRAVGKPQRDSNGNISRITGVFQDITQQKQIQNQLMQSRIIAENASRTKSQFLANMSHELRTPMNGVIGMTKLLEETNLDSEQKEYVDIINTSSQALLNILNDILDFSKIEAGKLTLRFEEFSITKLLNRVLKLIKVNAAQRGVLIETDCQVNQNDKIISDELRLGQIITNLIGNAVKFTPENGIVAIRLKYSASSINNDNKGILHFSVSDSGIGMTEEQLKSIFNEFTQADITTERRFGGTGLGLTISKKLVELLGGEIKVTSKFEFGTTFSIEIPVELGENFIVNNDPAIKSNELSHSLKDEITILLAEDNIVNVKLVEKLLKKRGYKVIVAFNGLEAIEAYKQYKEKIHLILMDCQMPILDGFDATKKIRQLEANKKVSIPIIAMTANAIVGDKEKCIEAGMNDYISKPFDSNLLFNLLEQFATKVQEK
jgi:PAS domain S-box-containing protein